MSKSARNDHGGLPRARAGGAVLGFMSALLAACGGGDGSVGIGTGQDPDPVALDFPIAYTKGPLFDAQMQLQTATDLRDTQRFNVGTDLHLLDRASPSAVEQNITLVETQGLGDVMGVEISDDGTRVLFAMRGPFDPNLADEDQPTWNIWEYDIPTATLRRIIASDITAEAGQDISPHYLPDGRIIFASTRQRQSKATLLDEGKPQFDALDEDRNDPALVLHVMDSDGNNLHQVSFNQSHDFDPTVLDSGKIMFSRWDHASGVNGIHLYKMNPDGSELELLYGAESHLTGTNNSEVQFVGAREMLNGDIMAIIRPFDHPDLGGNIVIIDAETYVENTQPTAANAGLPGPAQSPATPNQVTTDLAPSQGGRFSSAFPLWDGTGRVLVSWAICRLVENTVVVPCTDARLADPNAVTAPPLYGIWMYDPTNQTQLPVVIGEEGVLIGDVVAAQPRTPPQVILDKVPGVDLDPDLVAENVGILNIRSVYDIDGVSAVNIAALADPAVTAAAQRPARFLRIEKAVSIPDDDVHDFDDTAFGPNIQLGMRELVTYAPVEPDGSVRVKVPANVALAVSVLDADGRRISARHRNWIQVLPGEELRCNGCHAPQSGLSHGRRESFDPAYAGAPSTGVPFPNTVSTFVPDFGETMAETRTRVSCQTDCAALEASLDLVYADVWTDPNVRAPDGPVEYRYSGLTTSPPTTVGCVNSWSSNCRGTINYEMHIHPLWSLVRLVIDPVDMVTVLEDNTCARSGCHAPLDAMNMTAVPAAQLDLTDGLSPDEMAHFNAYRELLFTDNEQELVNGALQDRLVQNGVDAMGNPILVTVAVNPSMSSAGANASSSFDVFDAGGTHEGRLTAHELRLISEWLDIGAQYYNNPFDAPEN
jgi:Hydrazine synthase alpha subunit middle domain